ncbi:Grx4 family monothiol glutaredoxin [Candidatus Bandiella numerosa]|uniref:Grx4 family monothiol glutaredoxin n=1 Tax=Candidatus Bandiella numerosa TaxID=2570586 RepID=UPI001F0215B6|nr:Grx4 family monothiol glutaredoxin [Candidatus Bandiella numerosa]
MNQDIHNQIKKIIEENRIVLFMKGTPEIPMCGFSAAVVNILNISGVEFLGINVLDNDEMRQGIKEYSDWPTIPQLYINQEFVGGCDIVQDMYKNGELQDLLAPSS